MAALRVRAATGSVADWRDVSVHPGQVFSRSCMIRLDRLGRAGSPYFTELKIRRRQKNNHSLPTLKASTLTPVTEEPGCFEIEEGVPEDQIPATVITGFLGSGKTTLLNHILRSDHGRRIAVIENEYGEVDIDGSLVASREGGSEDIVTLDNGCICCTVRGDLVRMVSELVEKKRGRFDHIIIETTGLANPAPIIQTFYSEEKILNSVRVDGIVTIVDAKNAHRHLDEVRAEGVISESVAQIAYADRILVNKVDLVGEREIGSLTRKIRNINGMARMKRTEFGKVDLDYVLGIGGFDMERIEIDPVEDHDHHDGHCDHQSSPSHDPGVSSVSLVCEGNLDIDKVNEWLGKMLVDRVDDMYRVKGILAFNGSDERHVFQGVHDMFELSADRPWKCGELRTNRIVFIGKNLEAAQLNHSLRNCLAK